MNVFKCTKNGKFVIKTIFTFMFFLVSGLSFTAKIVASETEVDVKPLIQHELESLNIAIPRVLSADTKRIHSALVQLWQQWAQQFNTHPHFITLN